MKLIWVLKLIWRNHQSYPVMVITKTHRNDILLSIYLSYLILSYPILSIYLYILSYLILSYLSISLSIYLSIYIYIIYIHLLLSTSRFGEASINPPHWEQDATPLPLGRLGRRDVSTDSWSSPMEVLPFSAGGIRKVPNGGCARPGKHTKNYGKWPFMVDLPSIEMVIFHSHVSLPEGNMNWSRLFRCSWRDVGGCSMDWKIHQKLMAFWSLVGGVLRYKRQFSNRPRSSQIHSFGKSLVLSN